MRYNRITVTLFEVLSVLSGILGVIYLLLKSEYGYATVNVIKEDDQIENSIYLYNSIFWIIVFALHVSLKSSPFFNKFVYNVVLAVFCFFVWIGILVNGFYTFNNQDTNIIKTEKLTIIDTYQQQSKQYRGRRPASTNIVNGLITDSEDKDLKIITSNKDLRFYDLEIGDVVYARHYKGKLNAAFAVLFIP